MMGNHKIRLRINRIMTISIKGTAEGVSSPNNLSKIYEDIRIQILGLYNAPFSSKFIPFFLVSQIIADIKASIINTRPM